MTLGLQHIWQGLPGIKLPPNAEIVVGPIIHVPPPPAYLRDTEKYSAQVRLKSIAHGGFVPVDYTAGAPFPGAATNPNDPHRAVKLLYDEFYNYKPWLMYKPHVRGYEIDRYGNVTRSLSDQVIVRMRYISDTGMPHTLPDALPGVWLSQFVEQFEPEESKYTEVLSLFYTDVSKPNDIYVYIPALRRSLRSSSASRCAPFLGSDNFYDDINGGFNGIPSWFTVKLLKSPKAILADTHVVVKSFKPSYFYTSNFFWPKPILGKWQVRPVFPLELRPIKAYLPGYCYPKKIIYVDKDNYQILADDRWDQGMHYWKGAIWSYQTEPVYGTPGAHTFNSFQNAWLDVVDFEYEHYSPAYFNGSVNNAAVPAKYHSIARYATPTGLDQVMQ